MRLSTRSFIKHFIFMVICSYHRIWEACVAVAVSIAFQQARAFDWNILNVTPSLHCIRLFCWIIWCNGIKSHIFHQNSTGVFHSFDYFLFDIACNHSPTNYRAIVNIAWNVLFDSFIRFMAIIGFRWVWTIDGWFITMALFMASSRHYWIIFLRLINSNFNWKWPSIKQTT